MDTGRKFHTVRRAFLVAVLAVLGRTAAVQAQENKPEVFPPESGKGAVVLVVSGASGTTAYRSFASKLSKLGYYAVLIDGTTVYKRYAPASFDGAAVLQAIISESQTAPQAQTGKVGLIGFSAGGAGVLVHGAQMKDYVAAVVAYYPAITPLGPNFNALAAKLQVPVLVIAGGQDRYADCCLIESMRSLAGAPKTVPFGLTVYPSADHGFNLEDTQFAFREQDAQDSWNETVAYMRVHLQSPAKN